MTHRQRFLATMRYQPCDRAPLYDFGFWEEIWPIWQQQGLPATINRRNAARYFGIDCSLGGGEPPGWCTSIQAGLCPSFESRILEEHGDEYTLLQDDGVIVRRQRSSVSIPMHIGHTLTDRASWREHYLPRLDPDNPQRLHRDWEQHVAAWSDPHRTQPLFAPGGSLFGRLRDWMGLENIALVVYDDPAWFEEMVTTMADLSMGVLQRLFDAGARIDALSFWEDMCYNAGPLISPTHFKQYLVPHYRRMTDLARKHGCEVAWVDCDGRIDDLLPLWLESGVNCMFPIEVGTWGADPVRYRERYGQSLRMMGGFDKRILAQGTQAIEREIHRLAPLVEAGGFIPMPDHRVPPDVPLSAYVHYARTARAVWGKGIDLEPMECDHG